MRLLHTVTANRRSERTFINSEAAVTGSSGAAHAFHMDGSQHPAAVCFCWNF